MMVGQSKKLVSSLMILLLTGFASGAFGEDYLLIQGQILTDQEMVETRGGFSFDGGEWISFNFDFLNFNFIKENQGLANEETVAWVNALSQRATISESGITLDMDLIQGGAPATTINEIGQVSNIVLNQSFTDISGWVNANIISGDGNIATISNIINVEVSFYGFANMQNPIDVISMTLR